MGAGSLALYWVAQVLGSFVGVMAVHAMFDLPILQIATKSRTGIHLGIAEAIATFGLIAVIALTRRTRVAFAPLSIAAYITSAYWFTSSTSFANPATTLARALTDTFCGIAPTGVPQFIAAQLLGAILAFLLLRRI
jgi:glycerol uptake facilitator-like aquaporin